MTPEKPARNTQADIETQARSWFVRLRDDSVTAEEIGEWEAWLRADPAQLQILGDGTQSKSYIHVDDVVRGIQYFVGRDTAPYTYYHLATGDYLTVREIADLVIEEMKLGNVKYVFSGGSRGWAGDVPVVRFDLTKVWTAGWRSERSSREAMRAAIRSMLAQKVPL